MPNNGQSRRRQFLGAVGSMTTALVAGCGSSVDDGDGGGGDGGGGDGGGGDGGGDGSSDQSKYGGAIRTRESAGVASLNPIMNTSGAGYAVTSWLYSKLTRTDQNLESYGDLAEDWEATEDASEWTFHLRDNATFNHNGEPVTAEDVKASIEKMHDPDTGSPGAETLPTLDKVEVVDEHTVQILLTEPDADVDIKLANRWAGILPQKVINDEEMFESAQNEPFGSGAWELEEFSRDSRVALSSSDNWHITSEDGEELPYIDEAIIRVIPEGTSFVNSARQQELDLQQKEIAPSLYGELEEIDHIDLHEVPSGRSYPILMNPSVEPFSDRRIRHAIKYAVNKEAILEVAGQNYGVIGQDNFVSPVHRFYTDLPEEFGTTSEIEAAQEELEAAGYPDGIQIDIPLMASPEMSQEQGQTAVIAQENCREVGIEFEIEEVSSDYWLSNVEGQADFYIGNYGLRIVEDQILRQVLHSNGPWNYGWSNEEFDNAIDEASRTTDRERRQELYADAQRIAQMNAGMITPYFAASVGFTQDYVENYKQDPTTLQVPIFDTWLTSEAPTK